jgi:hypothetical protein
MSNVLDFGVNGLFPSKVGGSSTSALYFPRLAALNANPIFGQAPATPSSTSAAGALMIPNQSVFNGQQFDVIASGNFGSDTGDPSGTVTVQLYAVTGSASAPTYTSIATTGAMTPAVAIQPWGISATLLGDSASGLLIGSYQALKDGSVTAPTTITSVITGLDFQNGNSALGGNYSMVGGNPVFGLVVGVTFGTGNATNKASLYQFSVES